MLLQSLLRFVAFQALFASFVPEIADILGSRSKYGGSYKKEHGKRSDFARDNGFLFAFHCSLECFVRKVMHFVCFMYR